MTDTMRIRIHFFNGRFKDTFTVRVATKLSPYDMFDVIDYATHELEEKVASGDVDSEDFWDEFDKTLSALEGVDAWWYESDEDTFDIYIDEIV